MKLGSQTQIDRYISLLKEYNAHTNVYSENAYSQLDFHIQDGIALADLISNHAALVYDFGSGSGLPSIVLAILNPKNEVVAIESKSRKTRFLLHLKTELALDNLTVVQSDVNEYARKAKAPQVITAKAFAPFEDILRMSKPFLKERPRFLIPISAKQTLLYSDPKFKIIEKQSAGFTFYYLTLA